MNYVPMIFCFLVCASTVSCGGGGGGGSSNNTVAPPPPAISGIAIASQPQNHSIVEGQIATFQVSAMSTAPMSYQWQLNGVDIAGATAASYTTTLMAASADGQQYRVRLTTSDNSATSTAATLRVYTDITVPAPTEYSVNPSATDSAIDNAFGANYAFINSTMSPRGKLFVFFPGTNATPSEYRLILRAAANNGYLAIGLAYSNAQIPFDICTAAVDVNCAGGVREEQLSGSNASTALAVDAANSIENRLRKMLQYLAQQNPQQGWGNFLDENGNTRWELIRVAGHSQGAGTAAYIGKRHVIDRAILFSGPAEQILGVVASWVSTPGVTNTDRYYGLTHLRDPAIPLADMQQNWLAMQMGVVGSFENVDTATPPYQGSHILLSNRDTTGAIAPSFHNMTAADDAIPLDTNSLPVYRFAWQYLCFQ